MNAVPHDEELAARIHALADGELAGDEAERVRDHLADCAACQAELEDAMVVRALAEERPRVSRRRRVSRWAAVGVLVAAAAGVALAFWRVPRRPVEVAVLATERHVEGRLAHPAFANHRPYDVARGPGRGGPVVSARTLAELEERGEWHALGDALIAGGDVAGARRALERAGEGAAVRADRVLVQLMAGDAPGALDAADAALAAARGAAAAAVRWNRALALSALGLQALAAREFEGVAAVGEPGWSAEARDRARSLRAALAERARGVGRAPAPARAEGRGADEVLAALAAAQAAGDPVAEARVLAEGARVLGETALGRAFAGEIEARRE